MVSVHVVKTPAAHEVVWDIADAERMGKAKVKLAWIRLATLDLTYLTSLLNLLTYTHLLQKEEVYMCTPRGAGCVGEAGTYRQ